MPYRVEYLSVVLKEDIPGLDTDVRKRIKTAVEEKLMSSPDVFGKPLRHGLRGYRTLRIGDHRIVFRIGGAVTIVAIMHRREGYEAVEKRIR